MTAEWIRCFYNLVPSRNFAIIGLAVVKIALKTDNYVWFFSLSIVFLGAKVKYKAAQLLGEQLLHCSPLPKSK